MNESRRFSVNTATTTQVNHLLRGNRGVPEGSGAQRPSGAGSTRQPALVGSGGGRGGVEAGSGAGRLMLRVPADRLVRHVPSVPVGPLRIGLSEQAPAAILSALTSFLSA